MPDSTVFFSAKLSKPQGMTCPHLNLNGLSSYLRPEYIVPSSREILPPWHLMLLYPLNFASISTRDVSHIALIRLESAYSLGYHLTGVICSSRTSSPSCASCAGLGFGCRLGIRSVQSTSEKEMSSYQSLLSYRLSWETFALIS